MKSLRRLSEHRGYSRRGIFHDNRFRNSFSTRRLMLACALAAAGVSMLTWFLYHTKAAM